MNQREIAVLLKLKGDFSESLKQVEKNTEKSTGQMKENFLKMSAAVGAAAVVFAGFAVNEARQFEKSMSDVSTLIQGDATNAINQLSEGILKLSKTVPKNPQELGSAAYAIFSAGITDTAEALDVLEHSAKLATAGLGTTDEAVGLMTIALNAFESEGLSAAETNDILFKTVKNGITDVSRLSQGFGNAAGAAVSANISLVDLQASTAALSAVTGKTSESQNALRQIYIELTAAGGKLDKELQANGSSLEELNKMISENGGTVAGFEAMKKELKLTDTEFKNLFSSSEAQGAAFQLLTSANEGYNTTLDDMLNGANAVNEAFLKQTETFDAQWQLLQNQLTTILIELGSEILPYMTEAVALVSEKMDEMHGWVVDNQEMLNTIKDTILTLTTEGFNKLVETVGFVITKFTEMSQWANDNKVAAELLTIFIGSLITAFLIVKGAILAYNGVMLIAASVTGGFTAAIAILTSPITIIIGIIALLIYTGVLLYKNWELITEKAGEAWGKITETIGGALNGMRDTVVRVGSEIWSSITGTFNSIWDSAVTIWNNITGSIETAITSARNFLFDTIDEMKNAISGFFSSALDSAGSLVGGFRQVANAMIDNINNALRTEFEIFGQTIVIDMPDIPKFANGGDFIVPEGFNNDSFPIMVESGERVQVTPANQVSNDNSRNFGTINIYTNEGFQTFLDDLQFA